MVYSGSLSVIEFVGQVLRAQLQKSRLKDEWTFLVILTRDKSNELCIIWRRCHIISVGRGVLLKTGFGQHMEENVERSIQ